MRLALLLTGKPCRTPAPRLAAPSARNSWLASRPGPSPSWPVNARAVRMKSVYATMRTPRAGQHEMWQLTEVRQREAGQPRRHLADHLDAVPAVEVEGHHGERAEDDGEQGPGDGRNVPPRREDECQDRRGHDDGGRVDVGQVRDEGPQLGEELRARRPYAGELGQLVHHHDQRHARKVADQHRAGEQVREEAQPHRPCHQTQQSDRDREGCRKRRVVARVTARERADDRGRHERGRGFGPHREQA